MSRVRGWRRIYMDNLWNLGYAYASGRFIVFLLWIKMVSWAL